MAIPVIDVLKPVDIQIDDTNTSHFSGHLLHIFNVTVSVVKGCQGIVIAEMGKLLLILGSPIGQQNEVAKGLENGTNVHQTFLRKVIHSQTSHQNPFSLK